MNPWRGLGHLPRAVWVLSFVTLINRAGMMALPFLVLYLTKNFGYAATTAGLVITIYGLGALIFAPISGRLSDRFGPFRLMQYSLLLSGVILLCFPLVARLEVVLPLTLLWAIISEAFRPASLSAITGIVPAEQRKTAYALNRLAINLGMSIGPAAGGFLILRHSFFRQYDFDCVNRSAVKSRDDALVASPHADAGRIPVRSRIWREYFCRRFIERRAVRGDLDLRRNGFSARGRGLYGGNRASRATR